MTQQDTNWPLYACYVNPDRRAKIKAAGLDIFDIMEKKYGLTPLEAYITIASMRGIIEKSLSLADLEKVKGESV